MNKPNKRGRTLSLLALTVLIGFGLRFGANLADHIWIHFLGGFG